MADISDKRIAILATDGFEQSELMVPKQRLEEAGAMVDIISLKTGEIWGWDHDDWGEPIEVDRTIDAVRIDEYDALVIPGGQINPDLLRQDEDAVALVRDFYASKKPLAAICHAPWVLIEAGIAKGPQDDLVSFHGDRREECRRRLGRQGSGCRSRPYHQPQSRTTSRRSPPRSSRR